jgi:hypothetical protein
MELTQLLEALTKARNLEADNRQRYLAAMYGRRNAVAAVVKALGITGRKARQVLLEDGRLLTVTATPPAVRIMSAGGRRRGA